MTVSPTASGAWIVNTGLSSTVIQSPLIKSQLGPDAASGRAPSVVDVAAVAEWVSTRSTTRVIVENGYV